MTDHLCAWRPLGGEAFKRGGCPAIAAEDSDFCAAHRDQLSGKVEPRKRITRTWNPDKDPLPWDASDQEKIKALRPFSKEK